MAHLNLRLLAITIALFVLSGCVSSSQESLGTPSVMWAEEGVNDVQLETKVGVIDMIEVLQRSNIGQPAMAKWKREVEEADRRKVQHMAQFSQTPEFHGWNSPWLTARRNAINSVISMVEMVTKDIAEKHGFAVVMAKGLPETFMTTLYSTNAVDLTDQVIEELNRRFP